jgi:nitrate reductase NapAB chaperone NapD
MIVEIREGCSEAVMSSLAAISNLSVYGIKDNQVITVVEGDSTATVEETMKVLLGIENVTGVYPVYAGDFE